MSRYIDFRKLKQRVSIVDVFAHYGLRLREQGEALVGDCPLCGNNHENGHRFKATPAKGAWKCFACGAGGNLLDLVARMEDVTVQKSAVMIAEWFDVTDCNMERPRTARRPGELSKSAEGKSEKPPESQREMPTEAGHAGEDRAPLRSNPPLNWPGLKNLDPSREELSNIWTWLPEVAGDFHAGYCTRGMMQGRFAIPIHNRNGELLAYCGIAVDDSEPRLKFPPADRYDPSLDLFNLHRAIDTPLFEAQGLIVVEDIIDAVAVYQTGNHNVVATMAAQPTGDQLLRLRELAIPCRRLTVLWREPSEDLRTKIVELAETFWVRLVTPNLGAEIRELDADAIHAFLS